MTGIQKTSVIIVDDHDIVREGIQQVINTKKGFEVIGSANDGREGLALIRERCPDIAILDISLPTMSGIDIVRELSGIVHNTRIIMLTRHDSLPYLDSLLKLGISSYILKDHAVEELSKALPEVVKGQQYISPFMQKLLQDQSQNQPSNLAQKNRNTLTSREREILKLVAEGQQSKEISKILHISYHTVKVHRRNIFQKLGAKNVSDLVKHAIKLGLLDK